MSSPFLNWVSVRVLNLNDPKIFYQSFLMRIFWINRFNRSEQSDGKPTHNPNALDTSNPPSSPKGIIFSPSMFVASPESYEPPKGPLRVNNKNSQFDTQSLSENSQSPTEPLRVVNNNSQLDAQSLSEDSLPPRGPLRVVNNTSPIETQTVSDDSSSPDPTVSSKS